MRPEAFHVTSPSPTCSSTGTPSVQHPPLAAAGRARGSTSTRSKHASTSSSRTFRRFAEFARWGGKRVLEIGCGIGTDTINFARAGATSRPSSSRRSRWIAAQRAEVLGVADRIPFVQANAEELTSAPVEEPYDLVYSFGVIHHTPHPERVLAEMRDAHGAGRHPEADGLPPALVEGVLDPAAQGKGRFWKTDELVAEHSEAQTGCPVTFTYTRGELRELLERQRLPRQRSLCRPRLPVADPRLRGVPLRQGPVLPLDAGTRCSAAFERRLGWHLLSRPKGS